MVAKENYEALGGRVGLMAAMHQALNDLRKFPYFGFIPEEKRAYATERLINAIQFMETHLTTEFLPTRLLFPETKGAQEVKLALFLQRQEFHFCHQILFAPIHDVAFTLYRATGIMYPEVLMDVRVAYNIRFNPGSLRDYSSTEPAPLGPN